MSKKALIDCATCNEHVSYLNGERRTWTRFVLQCAVSRILSIVVVFVHVEFRSSIISLLSPSQHRSSQLGYFCSFQQYYIIMADLVPLLFTLSRKASTDGEKKPVESCSSVIYTIRCSHVRHDSFVSLRLLPICFDVSYLIVALAFHLYNAISLPQS